MTKYIDFGTQNQAFFKKLNEAANKRQRPQENRGLIKMRNGTNISV